MKKSTLLDLYTSRLDGLIAFSKSLPADEDCDGPFLMSEPSAIFRQSSHRILVIGQETNGWYGGFQTRDLNDILECVETYRNYNFSNNVFFRYYRHLGEALAGSSEVCVWNNLFKFGRKSGKGTVSDRVNDAEMQYFNVLSEEIETLDPTCVLFLTGPNYDHFLQQRIPDATFHPIGRLHLRQLAKVNSTALPDCSYRLYHPGYGNRDTAMYLESIELVKTDYSSKYSK